MSCHVVSYFDIMIDFVPESYHTIGAEHNLGTCAVDHANLVPLSFCCTRQTISRPGIFFPL